MPNDPAESPATQQAKDALKKGFADVQSPEDARKVLDEVEKAEQAHPPADDEPADLPPPIQAAVLQKTARQASEEERPAAVIEKAAELVLENSPDNQEHLDHAIHAAGREPSAPAERGRNFLRQELVRRLRPLDAADTILYLQLNRLPHPSWADLAMSKFSRFMTGGHAWTLVILFTLLRNRPRGLRVLAEVLPALYLATFTIEFPIKRYFRRRRPFISIVRAIVVGRKPGSYSFPSGHSAAAFAGATLLKPHYPRAAKLFFGVALLVAFSRVYLGAHYPGDVLTGGLAGAGLAKTYRGLLRKLWGGR